MLSNIKYYMFYYIVSVSTYIKDVLQYYAQIHTVRAKRIHTRKFFIKSLICKK